MSIINYCTSLSILDPVILLPNVFITSSSALFIYVIVEMLQEKIFSDFSLMIISIIRLNVICVPFLAFSLWIFERHLWISCEIEYCDFYSTELTLSGYLLVAFV